MKGLKSCVGSPPIATPQITRKRIQNDVNRSTELPDLPPSTLPAHTIAVLKVDTHTGLPYISEINMPGPATNLAEAYARLKLEPLSDHSDDYVDLSAARGSKCLQRLESHLRASAINDDPRCHLAFIGHRGSGKSTELIRMEERLSDTFFPIHLYVDDRLQRDADYPDLFLWLVESIEQHLEKAGIHFPPKHADEVANWFREVTKFETHKTEQSTSLGTEAKASAGVSFFGTGLKLIAQLKSAIVGSRETRTEMRKEVKKRPEEFITLVNNFIHAAAAAVVAAGKPGKLLVVQDNLDRLDRDAALQLFQVNGENLKRLDIACVWTPPVGSLLSPFNIGLVFPHFPMPMISVRKRDGKTNPAAIAGLIALMEKRLSIASTFAAPGLVKELILASGGSIREFIRLTADARLNADVDSHGRIEKSDIKTAIKDCALQLQNSFYPSNVYFPILASIYLHKEFRADLGAELSTAAVDARRHFYHSLIAEEAVFAYNGDANWEDVHPSLHVLDDFKKAVAALPPIAS